MTVWVAAVFLNEKTKPIIMPTEEKKWLTLNQHGKNCLSGFIHALSGTDLLSSQIDYLYRKDLIGSNVNFKDKHNREELAGYCLTDLGIETLLHYFPKYGYKK